MSFHYDPKQRVVLANGEKGYVTQLAVGQRLEVKYSVAVVDDTFGPGGQVNMGIVHSKSLKVAEGVRVIQAEKK
jgi:hypothetical protein